jgi:hypothetical protein
MSQPEKNEQMKDNLTLDKLDVSGSSLREKVEKILNKNPLISARYICQILGIPYKHNRQKIYNIKNRWKSNIKYEGGSNPSFHGWYGWNYIPEVYKEVLDLKRQEVRERLVSVGWKESKAKNKWLYWSERLGRIQWYQTGRLRIYCRKPSEKTLNARVKQLMANAFFATHVISNWEVMEQLMAVKHYGLHVAYETGQRQPMMTVTEFKDSNGIIIKLGDKSHPSSLEVISLYPDWHLQTMKALDKLGVTMEQFVALMKPQVKEKEDVTYIT